MSERISFEQGVKQSAYLEWLKDGDAQGLVSGKEMEAWGAGWDAALEWLEVSAQKLEYDMVLSALQSAWPDAPEDMNAAEQVRQLDRRAQVAEERAHMLLETLKALMAAADKGERSWWNAEQAARGAITRVEA